MFRPPTVVGDLFLLRNSTTSTCTTSYSSVSEDTTSFSGMQEKDVRNLEEELFRLRESTKAALQQSWNEVESLQRECSTNAEITAQLEGDLIDIREKETTWRVRCLTAEAKLMSSLQGDESQSSKRTSFRENMLSWTNVNVDRNSKDSMPKDHDCSAEQSKASGEDSHSTLLFPQNHDKTQELSLKIASRDEAITSLEETLEQNVKSMQNMQSEMQCLMTSQRIKEKNIADSHRRKEERLEKLVQSLRKKSVMKDSCVRDQQRKLSDYRMYIEELTSELEKVLQIVQSVEDTTEISLNHNFSQGGRLKSEMKGTVDGEFRVVE